MTTATHTAAASVLLVEPPGPARAFLTQNLTADRYRVRVASDASAALGLLGDMCPDLAVIALDLPDAGGLELVSRIRSGTARDRWDPGMPILGISRERDPYAVVRALERGADDHVARPLHPAELAARAAALMRRSRGQTVCDQLRVGSLVVDRRARHARYAGMVVELSGKEFALLEALARDPQRVVTKGELLRDVWGYAAPGRTRTVDSHASRLRRKLEAAGAGRRYVGNVWGIGYRLLADAT